MANRRLIKFDWAMKTILRDKANFDVLEGFLSALLEDDEIKILNILESESNQLSESDKFNRVDLLVQDKDNRKIYIEIQNTRETDYLESLLYATSKIITDHQKIGLNFQNISKVISISILYFNLGVGDDYLYYGTNDFYGMNTNNRLILNKRVKFENDLLPKYKMIEKNIFPEYYLINVERYKNIVQRKIDEWIYMFKNDELLAGSTSRNIDKAEQKLLELNMTEQERRIYEKYWINKVRDKDVMETALFEADEKGFNRGIQSTKDNAIRNALIKGKLNN